MKSKNGKIDKVSKSVKAKIFKDIVDDAYSQINQVSFQQNFKTLIGHFKKESSFPTSLSFSK